MTYTKDELKWHWGEQISELKSFWVVVSIFFVLTTNASISSLGWREMDSVALPLLKEVYLRHYLKGAREIVKQNKEKIKFYHIMALC